MEDVFCRCFVVKVYARVCLAGVVVCTCHSQKAQLLRYGCPRFGSLNGNW